MATNKHAIIRYRALDKCFGNFRQKFFMEDLIEACRKAIYKYTGIDKGISKRQVFEDIIYMESEEGWNIPLKRFREGRKVYYRYEDMGFSINHQPISPMELDLLKDAIFFLNRFQGMPQLDWMFEILSRFEKTLNIKQDNSVIVCFHENPDLKGLHFFTDIFNAIITKQVLMIEYKYFSKVSTSIVYHPYYLKQYNNRWFLFGYGANQGDTYELTNLALDRIDKIEVIQDVYIENKNIDFFEYFYDIVGVSIPPNAKKERILLKVGRKAFNYIETKPFHASQKILEIQTDYSILELDLIINFEFESQLLIYADEIEIISPIHLRESIKSRAVAIYNKNK